MLGIKTSSACLTRPAIFPPPPTPTPCQEAERCRGDGLALNPWREPSAEVLGLSLGEFSRSRGLRPLMHTTPPSSGTRLPEIVRQQLLPLSRLNLGPPHPPSRTPPPRPSHCLSNQDPSQTLALESPKAKGECPLPSTPPGPEAHRWPPASSARHLSGGSVSLFPSWPPSPPPW